MFADKLLRKNKKIRQACKVEGKILSTFSLSLYIRKVFGRNDFYRRIVKTFSSISCNNIIKFFKIGAFHLESIFQVIPIVILTYSRKYSFSEYNIKIENSLCCLPYWEQNSFYSVKKLRHILNFRRF